MGHLVLLLLFMWMETKAHRGEGTCSKPHSTELAELEREPDLSPSQCSPHCPSPLLLCLQGVNSTRDGRLR